MNFAPQAGPQTDFLSSTADIAIYGGAAGGGKTFALLLEPLRYIKQIKGFGAVIFRRTVPMIRSEGGMWSESEKIYPHFAGRPFQSILEWRFWNNHGSINKIKFSHMEHEKDRYDWQGSQIPLICFDELTQFEESQFWYMLSRNRTKCGVKPYIRATTNPDPDSFVRTLIDWWLDEKGLPIKKRSGKIRYFIRLDNTLYFADDKWELIEQYGTDMVPKSLTFIPADLSDNPILLRKDPSYVANLKALPEHEKQKLLHGNWNARPSAGQFFKREWFDFFDTKEKTKLTFIRYWDKAATEPTADYPDPDWTVGILLARDPDGFYYVFDMIRFRGTPAKVEKTILKTAQMDGMETHIMIEEEGGSSGKETSARYANLLAGYTFKPHRPTGDKITRAEAVSSAAENNLIKIKKADWNASFLNELESFPEGKHDDIIDALSGAFNNLTHSRRVVIGGY